MRPGGSAMSRMIDRFVTDLPEPDSPTMPSVSPLRRSKLTPLTALTTSSSMKKKVLRSWTESRTSPLPLPLFTLAPRRKRSVPLLLAHLRIERVADAVAQEVQAEQRERDHHAGEDEHPRVDRHGVDAVGRERAPA